MAMFGAIIVAIIVYVLMSVMVFGSLGADEVVKDVDTAIAVAAESVVGQWGVVLSVIAAAFATVSTVLANLCFGLNTSFSLAVNGSLPARYARNAWKGATFGLILTAIRNRCFSRLARRGHSSARCRCGAVPRQHLGERTGRRLVHPRLVCRRNLARGLPLQGEAAPCPCESHGTTGFGQLGPSPVQTEGSDRNSVSMQGVAG
jgi:hypothetical protein